MAYRTGIKYTAAQRAEIRDRWQRTIEAITGYATRPSMTDRATLHALDFLVLAWEQ
jgi:hypothetical protein